MRVHHGGDRVHPLVLARLVILAGLAPFAPLLAAEAEDEAGSEGGKGAQRQHGGPEDPGVELRLLPPEVALEHSKKRR